MNRWMIRILGIVMLVVFTIVFVNLYNRLATLQRSRPPAAQTR